MQQGDPEPFVAALPTRIAVLGGGQLGRYLVEAGARLGVYVATLDANANAPARQVSLCAAHVKTGKVQHVSDVLDFLAQTKATALTFETEHVNVVACEQALTNFSGLKAYPSCNCMSLIQNKFAQKKYLKSKGIPLPEFAFLKNFNDISIFARENGGYPVLLKTCFGGYDGRGNALVASNGEATVRKAIVSLGYSESIATAFFNLEVTGKEASYCQKDPNLVQIFAERMLDFACEVAVMVLRDHRGDITVYPVVETVQRNGVCLAVLAPARLPQRVTAKVLEVAKKTVEAFEGPGLFGVELFVMRDGQVLVNEVAPRPHNSGHYTLDACHTSQFENLVRLIAGLPLGSTETKVPFAGMYNLLATTETWFKEQCLDCAFKISGSTVYLYGKEKAHPVGRKMGHVNFVANNYDDICAKFKDIDPTLAPWLSKPPLNEENVSLLPAITHSPVVSVIMGSTSDLKVMRDAKIILDQFHVPCEITVVSAHRTPDRMFDFAKNAHNRGIKVIIAGAGGAAHLPGMVAALTWLPVIGVPIALSHLDGKDSLLSIVQMPRGVPVATVAIDNATNAGLLAVRMLAHSDAVLAKKLVDYQTTAMQSVIESAARVENGDALQ